MENITTNLGEKTDSVKTAKLAWKKPTVVEISTRITESKSVVHPTEPTTSVGPS